jgi:hypothetical protein
MTCFALEFTSVKVLDVSLSNNFPMLGCTIHRKQQISYSPVVIKEKCDHSEVYTDIYRMDMFCKKVHIII